MRGVPSAGTSFGEGRWRYGPVGGVRVYKRQARFLSYAWYAGPLEPSKQVVISDDIETLSRLVTTCRCGIAVRRERVESGAPICASEQRVQRLLPDALGVSRVGRL